MLYFIYTYAPVTEIGGSPRDGGKPVSGAPPQALCSTLELFSHGVATNYSQAVKSRLDRRDSTSKAAVSTEGLCIVSTRTVCPGKVRQEAGQ